MNQASSAEPVIVPIELTLKTKQGDVRLSSNWRVQAECRLMPPELFFPKGETDLAALETEAKSVCRGCPVKYDCLMAAIAIEQGDSSATHGIWGGMNERERRKLRKDGVRVWSTLSLMRFPPLEVPPLN